MCVTILLIEITFKIIWNFMIGKYEIWFENTSHDVHKHHGCMSWVEETLSLSLIGRLSKLWMNAFYKGKRGEVQRTPHPYISNSGQAQKNHIHPRKDIRQKSFDMGIRGFQGFSETSFPATLQAHNLWSYWKMNFRSGIFQGFSYH